MNVQVARPDTEIGFHYLNERIPLLMVHARVNGQGPFEVILDTGNGLEAIALSPEVAEELGIVTHTETVEARFPIGLSKSLSLGSIDSFEIGDLRNDEMDAGILPALSELSQQLKAPIHGNIGFHFLKEYVVRLDFGRFTLTLSHEAATGLSTPIHIGQEKPLIIIDVEANGKPLHFVLDTGASYNCISLGAAAELDLTLGTEFSVNGSATDKAYMCRLASLTAAGQTQNEVKIAAVDFLGDLSDVAGMQIDGVLGHSFWSQYLLTIDYPRKRLFLAGRE